MPRPFAPNSPKSVSRCPACDDSPYGAPLPDPSVPLVLCQKCVDRHSRGPLSDARNNPVTLARAGILDHFPASSPPRPNLKRKVPSSPFEPLPSEFATRMFSSDDADSEDFHISRDGFHGSGSNVQGPLLGSSVGGLVKSGGSLCEGQRSGDESDDDYVDAQESLPSPSDNIRHARGDDLSIGAETGELVKLRKIGHVEVPRHEQQHAGGFDGSREENSGSIEDEMQSVQNEEAPDLFNSSFGNTNTVTHISSDEDSASTSPSSSSSHSDSDTNESEHENDAPSSSPRGTNPLSLVPTTTSSSSPTNPSTPLDLAHCPIDPVKHTSPFIHSLTKFHHRALHFLPRLPLAPHRYWIGVLNHNETGRNLNSEKQFTWMRGNRLTTVRTVWRKYAEVNVVEGFALYIGGSLPVRAKGEEGRVVLGNGPVERPSFGVRMEELDYCGDRKVILRAILRGKSRNGQGVDLEVSGQRGLFDGLMSKQRVENEKVAEVVVLDDD